jgi:hypothetical protein
MLPLVLSLSLYSRRTWALESCLRTTRPDDSWLSQSTWLCCCSSFNCSDHGYGTLTCSPEVLPCPGPAVFDSLYRTCCLDLWMLGYEKPTDIFSWGTDLLHPLQPLWSLFDPAGHLWTFEHLEEQSGLKCPCTLIISTRHSQKRTGHPSEPGSSLGFLLGSCLSREFFLATVLLHQHCLMFGVLGWVSV